MVNSDVLSLLEIGAATFLLPVSIAGRFQSCLTAMLSRALVDQVIFRSLGVLGNMKVIFVAGGRRAVVAGRVFGIEVCRLVVFR